MVIVHSYHLAILMCFITMLCWGSWANTQKFAGQKWKFQLFYWDYCIGVLLFSIFFAFTLGSLGTEGRTFIQDLQQSKIEYLWSAFLGGVIFNIANILLVTAIDIAGMAVAFPVGVGLALIIGVVSTYILDPTGDVALLSLGVTSIVLAIILDAIAYKKLPSQKRTALKGITLSIVCGLLMGLFYRYVAYSIPVNLSELNLPNEIGKLTPYTALFVFSSGLFTSNFLFNSIVMKRPFIGDSVPFADYFRKGSFFLHSMGVLGGIIWGIGMSFSILAGDVAGYAISYGLGQGATMVAALWGIFVWKEFQKAPPSAKKFIAVMFVFYVVGIIIIIMARTGS